MKTNGNLGPLIRRLQGLAGTGTGADERTDGELLRSFVADKDGQAFAAIVRRHGALVLGVCRRVVRHEQDAEDLEAKLLELNSDTLAFHVPKTEWIWRSLARKENR